MASRSRSEAAKARRGGFVAYFSEMRIALTPAAPGRSTGNRPERSWSFAPRRSAPSLDRRRGGRFDQLQNQSARHGGGAVNRRSGHPGRGARRPSRRRLAWRRLAGSPRLPWNRRLGMGRLRAVCLQRRELCAAAMGVDALRMAPGMGGCLQLRLVTARRIARKENERPAGLPGARVSKPICSRGGESLRRAPGFPYCAFFFQRVLR